MRLSPLPCRQSGHSALLGALRREAAAAAATRRAAADAERLRELLRQRDMDAQRAKMIIRLKEHKVARLQARHYGGFRVGFSRGCVEAAAAAMWHESAERRDEHLPEGAQDHAAAGAALLGTCMKWYSGGLPLHRDILCRERHSMTRLEKLWMGASILAFSGTDQTGMTLQAYAWLHHTSQGMHSQTRIALEAGSGYGEWAAAERRGSRRGRIAAGGVHAAAGARGQ